MPSAIEQLKPESTAAGCDIGTAALEYSLALSLKSERQSIQLPSMPICFYIKPKCMCVRTKEETRIFFAALCSCQNPPAVLYCKAGKWWYICRFIGWISFYLAVGTNVPCLHARTRMNFISIMMNESQTRNSTSYMISCIKSR